MIDFSDALHMVSALSAHPPTPVARIPHQWPAADVSMIHKLLDAGYLVKSGFTVTRQVGVHHRRMLLSLFVV